MNVSCAKLMSMRVSIGGDTILLPAHAVSEVQYALALLDWHACQIRGYDVGD
jgi:hypothetical protein